MDAQTLRAETFKALHARDRAFVMPNPWDAGSAIMLASLGFEALATTSAGYAFSLGRPDAEGALSLEDTLVNATMIAKATALPVAPSKMPRVSPSTRSIPLTFPSSVWKLRSLLRAACHSRSC